LGGKASLPQISTSTVAIHQRSSQTTVQIIYGTWFQAGWGRKGNFYEDFAAAQAIMLGRSVGGERVFSF
jgi:hypothetical protein